MEDFGGEIHSPSTLEVDQDGLVKTGTVKDDAVFFGERKVNFTVNKTHRMYFRRNSKNVNMAILALKISV